MLRHIYIELKEHIPFTLLGAVFGVTFMLLFRNISHSTGWRLFTVFHPGHVVLSAMATAAMFRLHKAKSSFLVVLIVGYIGSVGIATLSDSVIPFFGEGLLGLNVPTHQRIHAMEEHSSGEVKAGEVKTENRGREGKIYLGFIEEWYIVNPAAIIGVIIAWFYPRTKFSHAGHVLISTWASSSYVLMTAQSKITMSIAMVMVLVLFVSTWLPCCISDIIFPLMLTDLPHSCGKCKTEK